LQVPAKPPVALDAGHVLLTSSDKLASGETHPNGLIMLLRLNSGKVSGAAVSIPPNAMAAVPGHGTMPVENVVVTGSPRC